MSTSSIEYITRRFDFSRYGPYPKVYGDHTPKELWNLWEERVFKLIKTDLNDGWEVDQSAWGPSCLEYQIKHGGMMSWTAGHWIAYIMLSLVTAGIGFFILPFVMKVTYFEINGLNVRLRRPTRT